MRPGHVYIMTNAAMPGIVKIGATTLSPDERCADLSATTAVPHPFEVFAAYESDDCFGLEAVIHSVLRVFRVNPRREFFHLPPAVAASAIARVLAEDDVIADDLFLHKAPAITREQESKLRRMVDPKAVGFAIKAGRARLGLTQEQLGAACGTGVRCIVEIERGKPTAQIGKVMALLQGVGLFLATEIPSRAP